MKSIITVNMQSFDRIHSLKFPQTRISLKTTFVIDSRKFQTNSKIKQFFTMSTMHRLLYKFSTVNGAT